MRSQSPFVPFHPELFQVKSKGEKKQFRSDIPFASRKEAPETEVIFQQTKGALNLNGPTKAKIDTVIR